MWKNQIKTVLLLGILSSLLVGMGGVLGQTYLVLFTGLALLMNLGAYFWSDKIVLRMYRARELSLREAPDLHAMVDELARRAEIPKPRLFLVPDAGANAFATGRNPDHGVVAVTSGILEVLSPRELRGVLAHEIAHIRNRDTLVSTVAAGIGTAVSYMANALAFSSLLGGSSDDEEGGSPLSGIAMMFVAPLLATLVQLGISRSREYMADETAARISGDPEALASALDKLHRDARVMPTHAQPASAGLFIVNPLSGEGLSSFFSTHPPAAERIRRLLGMVSSQRGVSASRPLVFSSYLR
jgi:heat shock protein HtpX